MTVVRRFLVHEGAFDSLELGGFEARRCVQLSSFAVSETAGVLLHEVSAAGFRIALLRNRAVTAPMRGVADVRHVFGVTLACPIRRVVHHDCG